MTELQILMPAHNEESYIEKILTNIYRTLSKRKIQCSFVICEDGSTDQTLPILKKLKKNKIKNFYKKNEQGYSNAIINGIKKVKSKYLMIMDSDG
jgi:glycosyltransferase involved in cell wall biosynthesis